MKKEGRGRREGGEREEEGERRKAGKGESQGREQVREDVTKTRRSVCHEGITAWSTWTDRQSQTRQKIRHPRSHETQKRCTSALSHAPGVIKHVCHAITHNRRNLDPKPAQMHWKCTIWEAFTAETRNSVPRQAQMLLYKEIWVTKEQCILLSKSAG